jgi:hypothetical protein
MDIGDMVEISSPNTPPQSMPLISDIWELLDDPGSGLCRLWFSSWAGRLVVALFVALQGGDVLQVVFASEGCMGLMHDLG